MSLMTDAVINMEMRRVCYQQALEDCFIDNEIRENTLPFAVHAGITTRAQSFVH